MFVNFSNHSSALWSRQQLEAAHSYGDIEDMPFPAVDPAADERYILEKAGEYAEKILSLKPSAVLVQGEMTLCYAVIDSLRKKGVKVLCATTERISESKVNEKGETVKTVTFAFVGFRDYISSTA